MTELVDPQLEAFAAASPELLAPDAPPTGAKVPAWYDNAVVELAGAIVAYRGIVALTLSKQPPPPLGQTAAVAGQAWRHHAPSWLQLAAPAIDQTYRAGRIRGLSPDELESMATDYAQGMGEYLSDTSAEALAEGFERQLAAHWSESVAWHRATAGYGLDRPDMRAFIQTVLAQPEGSRDVLGTGSQMLVDRLLIERAERVARNETWTASQSGLALSWLVRQRRGDLPPGSRRRWRTRHGETVCAICGPMDGVMVALDEPFVVGGVEMLSPSAHPGCQCSQELVEPVTKGRIVAAGIALIAASTGRALMLQRAHDEKDRAGGFWEFPGGTLERGEAPFDAARREWEEEVHRRLPSSARPLGSWVSGHYQGFAVQVPDESLVPSHSRGRIVNPDDPDGDAIEAIAWWDPRHLSGNPAVRPELRAAAGQVRRALDGKISKSKTLDDGRLDPYNRTKRGRFTRREERTRIVTHLLEREDQALSPAAQLIVDQALTQVRDPFATTKDPFGMKDAFARTADPFASTGDPFKTGDPFGVRTADPFAGPDPFANQKARTQPPKRRVEIHHILLPKKTDEDDYHLAQSGFYMPRQAWADAFEEDPDTYLAKPGDGYDFTELAAANADNAKYEGGPPLDEQVEQLLSQATDEQFGYERVNASRMAPELVDLFAQEAIVADDPWKQIVEPIEDWVPDAETDPQAAWAAIRTLAKPIFDDVMAEPDRFVDRLDRRQLDAIYDMAGYERNEDDDVARERIRDHVQARGLGDDSLAEAFGDYVTWNSVGTGADGNNLAYLLQQAAESRLPAMTQEYGVATPIKEMFVFDRGFHPDTQLRSGDTIADVGGDYTIHHVMYRSNLGETGGQTPFVGGIRELYMWPADREGRLLHGGPYADPVYGSDERRRK